MNLTGQSLIAGQTVAGSGKTAFGVNPATNDIGIITLKDGRRYAVAVFLAGSPASDAERDDIIADVARAVARAAG